MPEAPAASRDAGALWEESAGAFRRFIRARVPADDVDDVLQESFLRIHRSLPGLNDIDRLLPWAFRIVRGAIADYFRRKPAAPSHAEIDVPDAADDRVELGRCVAQILDSLPIAYRAPVRFVDWDGLTQKAAADRLGLSLSAAKSRVQRGRAKLRSALERCCEVVNDGQGRAIDFRRRTRRPECDCDLLGAALLPESEILPVPRH